MTDFVLVFLELILLLFSIVFDLFLSFRSGVLYSLRPIYVVGCEPLYSALRVRCSNVHSRAA